jgi:hypothetical protein
MNFGNLGVIILFMLLSFGYLYSKRIIEYDDSNGSSMRVANAYLGKVTCYLIMWLIIQTALDDGESLSGGAPPIYTFFVSFLITLLYTLLLRYKSV